MARLSGRPLLDNRADAAVFTNRSAELDRVRRALDERLNVLVSGDPGSGKTSVLRRLQHERRAGAPDGPAFVDAAAAESAAQVLERVAARLGRPERPGQADAVVDHLSGLAGATPADPVVLLDGLAVELAHPLFGQLRDELWQLPFSWVVTASSANEAAFRVPPADAFFEVVVRLEPMPDEQVRALLRARVDSVELPEPALAEVAVLAGGNPRRAVELARQLLVEPDDLDSLRARVRERDGVVQQLDRPAAMLLGELEALGAASASDERLLARVGWTRGRAAQVLAQLEDAGLVEATSQRNGPGRPRKVFRPTGKMTW